MERTPHQKDLGASEAVSCREFGVVWAPRALVGRKEKREGYGGEWGGYTGLSVGTLCSTLLFFVVVLFNFKVMQRKEKYRERNIEREI